MKNKSVRFKIMLAFFAVIFLFLLAMSLQFFSINSMKNQMLEMKNRHFAAVSLTDELQLNVVQVQQWLTDASATGYTDGYDEAAAHADRVYAIVEELRTLNPDWDSQLNDILAAFTPYYNVGVKMADAYIKEGQEAGNVLMEDFDVTAQAINEKVALLGNTSIASNEEAIASIELTVRNSMLQICIALLFLVLISIFIWTFIAKAIIRPLVQVTTAVGEISNGNLQVNVTHSSSDEIGQLVAYVQRMSKSLSGYVDEIARVTTALEDGRLNNRIELEFDGDFAQIKASINHLAITLTETISQINESSKLVDSGALQLSAGSQTLSEGATDQAASLEELSANMADLSTHINKNTESVGFADSAAQRTTQALEEGNHQIQSLMSAMDEISYASNEIRVVTKNIEDIVRQTNILALNVAVEAARAGEAGKGFAVIADEVRKMAGQSAEAAKHANVMVENSIQSVEKGSQTAKQTADTLVVILQEAEQITHSIEAIYQTAQKQAESAEQVNIHIEQISSVVQTTASVAEETAASSEELSSQAGSLQSLIDHFEL